MTAWLCVNTFKDSYICSKANWKEIVACIKNMLQNKFNKCVLDIAHKMQMPSTKILIIIYTKHNATKCFKLITQIMTNIYLLFWKKKETLEKMKINFQNIYYVKKKQTQIFRLSKVCW